MITGGSRGVGAETCLELATRGCDVAFTYRNKASRAEGIAKAARTLGVQALPIQADITDVAQINEFAARLRDWSGSLDLLVLNASGGLERDLLAKDPSYPMRVNRDAQLLVLEALVPLLAGAATVVFVTSHWAHLYGEVEQLPAYEPVAASKHAGEAALRARQSDLGARGIRLIVVTGDLVEGTITAKLLERKAARSGTTRAVHQGTAISPREMAVAIADAAFDKALPSGHTVVVGGALDSVPRSV